MRFRTQTAPIETHLTNGSMHFFGFPIVCFSLAIPGRWFIAFSVRLKGWDMRTEFLLKPLLCLVCTLAGASLVAAAPVVPSGWKVVRSPQRLTRTASPGDRGGGGLCQIAVPPAMIVDTQTDRTVGQTGHMKTPDGNLSVSIQEHPPGETLARAKEVAMMFNKDAKAKEDSPTRVWLTYTRAGTMYWDVLVSGNPVVCSAHFIINDDRLEDAANSIVPTVGPAR